MIFKKITIAFSVISILGSFRIADHPAKNITTAHFVKPLYSELPLGSIHPQGWLKDQLEIMRDGTTGHLDEVYAKLKNDNGWLGGKGDGWEETPYWLDGAVPLSWQLDDATLKAKVLKYINWTLDHQRPSGYFGPITKAERDSSAVINLANCQKGEDWWPKMVMLKAMQQYYTATNDPRVIKFMTAYFHYELQALKICPINKWSDWAESRGSENILVAQWLYQKTGDKSLLALADLLDKQCFAWSAWFAGRNWAINAAAHQDDNDWMHRHGVNVGMAIKAPALNYQRTGSPAYLNAMKTGFGDIMTLNGLPMGAFSADEDLHGNLPTQGTELCAVVETMYSMEEAMAITGDTRYMDALERITFNALPAQTTDDYNNKQYFQVANQVEIARGVFDFSLPFGREMNNVLGMRSGYTCCLANMHQGWTKYTQHLWFKTQHNGLASLVYGPNQLKTTVGAGNTAISVAEVTDYPFSDEIGFNLSTPKPVQFDWQFRIPAWCSSATISINGVAAKTGKAGQLVTISRVWKNGDKISLKLPMQVSVSEWGRNSRAVERGPLVYALKLGERWEKGHDQHEGDYFSVYPNGNWNYGLSEQIVNEPAKTLTVTEKPLIGKFVWNLQHAPIEIKAEGRLIPNWQLTDGVANQPVTDRDGGYRGAVSDTISHFTLIPYGFTKVRIVAFPVVKK
ncbi:beta-L-arabinofuranosidase domain-containing protein [uncultured Mucilaginibacter sp.]|uniref:beta-L-arabinofuranosidase domain-containing protein n=1 Tax=uncultured Mucilaginibacter sp. TaxID=797541 RepID=UPI0025CFAA8C|nr:beta-L-arabinofuranosidase domain-containing protein [uncultured Mucilaginibacter sp.]